jgi:hypothetical protein
MNKLADKSRKKAEERILAMVSVKCKECNGDMIRVINEFTYVSYDQVIPLGDETVVGYSCKSCPHYYLFTTARS